MQLRTSPASCVVREALEFSDEVAVRTSAASAVRAFLRGDSGSRAALPRSAGTAQSNAMSGQGHTHAAG
jgi:hypothetical protein